MMYHLLHFSLANRLRREDASVSVGVLISFAWAESQKRNLKYQRSYVLVDLGSDSKGKVCDAKPLFWRLVPGYLVGRLQPRPEVLFSCACSLSPPHTSRALGSATQGHARDRDSRAALGNPQDKGQFRQTYSGRSARVVTRPESQAASPDIINLPRRLSTPSHGSADRRLCPVMFLTSWKGVLAKHNPTRTISTYLDIIARIL